VSRLDSPNTFKSGCHSLLLFLLKNGEIFIFFLFTKNIRSALFSCPYSSEIVVRRKDMTLPYIADCAAVTRWTGLSLLIPPFFIFYSFSCDAQRRPRRSVHPFVAFTCVCAARPTNMVEREEGKIFLVVNLLRYFHPSSMHNVRLGIAGGWG
jgi:hypothetical protein